MNKTSELDQPADQSQAKQAEYQPLPEASGWVNKAHLISAQLGRERYGNSGACELHTWREGGPFDLHTEAIYTADQVRACIDADRAARAGFAPARPDILEKLTYHQHERDDLTLDECWEVLASGYRKVRGRTDRQMVMQILALLAARPPASK